MVGILRKKRKSGRHHIEGEDVETQREGTVYKPRREPWDSPFLPVLRRSQYCQYLWFTILIFKKKNNFKGLVALPYCKLVSAVQQQINISTHISTHF